ncbi:hypothetical protein KFK09_005765 [Dendrobium nobile]|uniref:Uncharacterized protein n=1 Tax=Dendrobium nobile TaxID=94219 RepID=A0A8T3BWL0_DENNO|nr:hypothetical protein KFK09_005765 [Dendrobium nobile]
MEASMMLKLITAVLVTIVAASSLVEQAAAADAPAPSPTSGAVTTSPALEDGISLSMDMVGFPRLKEKMIFVQGLPVLEERL